VRVAAGSGNSGCRRRHSLLGPRQVYTKARHGSGRKRRIWQRLLITNCEAGSESAAETPRRPARATPAHQPSANPSPHRPTSITIPASNSSTPLTRPAEPQAITCQHGGRLHRDSPRPHGHRADRRIRLAIQTWASALTSNASISDGSPSRSKPHRSASARSPRAHDRPSPTPATAATPRRRSPRAPVSDGWDAVRLYTPLGRLGAVVSQPDDAGWQYASRRYRSADAGRGGELIDTPRWNASNDRRPSALRASRPSSPKTATAVTVSVPSNLASESRAPWPGANSGYTYPRAGSPTAFPPLDHLTFNQIQIPAGRGRISMQVSTLSANIEP
jgi:hypothetical protein